MSSTSQQRRPRWPLVADTVRAHRWGVPAWIAGSAIAMVAIAAGFAVEVARFAGGAQGMADSMRPGVEAMRLLRWPADRLDTLGGYLAYHNVTLFTLALTLYAAVQGAHAVRGAEARGVPAEILATGRSRAGVLLDRAAGFAVTLTLIGLGLGAGLAVAMAVGGEPDFGGSLVTGFVVALCAFTGYALGVLVSQLTPSTRTGAGLAALLLAGLYLLTNVSDQVGPLAVLRFASPFHYANASRALVPGQGFDVASSLGLAAAAVAMLGAAAWAYEYRDYGAGLWRRRPRPTRHRPRVQRPALHALWSATLLRQRLGLLTWSVSAALALALMGWLEPAVEDMWNEFQYTKQLFGAEPGRSVADQYLGYTGQLVVPIVAAYVIAQATGWVNDLRQGRAELLLAAPVSWPRLVWQRLLATIAGTTVITAAAVAGLTGTALAAGIGVDPAGLTRSVAVTVLFAAALAGVAAVAVAWLRSTAAVAVLAAFLAASYLLVYLVPLLDWPQWVLRASVFGAYGYPYLEVPAWTGLAALTVLAVSGGLAAAAIAQRSPKVAT
ncbi:MAG TPA: ABC transporter permease subunit [Pseudonocardiaceae bacterium]|nr:ABC transporter permease subunit [Pseudonocardiaceae bacterium]